MFVNNHIHLELHNIRDLPGLLGKHSFFILFGVQGFQFQIDHELRLRHRSAIPVFLRKSQNYGILFDHILSNLVCLNVEWNLGVGSLKVER